MFGYLSSAGLLCIALTSLSLTSAEAVQQNQTKSLEPLIEQVTGRESVVNCGEYAISTPRSEEALLKSLACAEDSVKENKPSRIVVQMQGLDTFMAQACCPMPRDVCSFSITSAPHAVGRGVNRRSRGKHVGSLMWRFCSLRRVITSWA